MSLHDAGYKHWEGDHLGIWSRRAVIAWAGIRSCLSVRWMRYLILVCWVGCLVQVTVLFLLGQLLVADSLPVQWLGYLSAQLESFGRSLTTWLEEHPEISVRTTHNLLFFYFSSNLLTLALLALALAMPHLITRDLSSNAIVIYASKAMSRFDYLLGKFAALAGLLVLTWLGPVCVAWFLGNLLSPSWHFFWHSLVALGHSLACFAAAAVVLGVLGLGVSAMSSRARSTVSLWIAFWLLGNALVPIARRTEPWLKYFSLRFDLDQLALAVFDLQHDFKLAQENVPFFGEMLREMRRRSSFGATEPEVFGAVCGLGIMLVLAVILLLRKVRPQ